MAKEKAKEEEPKAATAESSPRAANSKAIAVAVVLALLIVVSTLQAVELAGLKERISTEFDNLATLSVASGGTTTSSSSTDLKKNLASLPSMVGGC